MKIDPFTDLMEEARIEAYDYFDQNIRKLPRVIALEKSKTGRNETYFELLKKVVLTREELVALIRAGKYRGYSVKLIRGIETPVSKRDGRRINNIG